MTTQRLPALAGMAIVFLLAVMPAGAQTITNMLALPPAWGDVEVERFVETDGDPATLEVIIWRYTDLLWRIVAVAPDGTLCAGRWFTFLDRPMAWPRFKRVGAVDVAFLTATLDWGVAQSYYYEVALDHPVTCLP